MDIKITKKVDKDHVTESLLVWKLSNQKIQKDTIIISVMCFVVFTIGIIKINRYESFWNPWSSLGIALAFMAIIFWIDIYTKKSKVI